MVVLAGYASCISVLFVEDQAGIRVHHKHVVVDRSTEFGRRPNGRDTKQNGDSKEQSDQTTIASRKCLN